MALDPDDPRPPFRQVANALRAAILTKKFEPGDRLPSQAELATNYGVARMTIQQALKLLREENLIVSRQGSGVFVRERTARPVGLRPHIEAAFERDDVTIDFSGYTAETLHGAIQEPIDKIRDGKLTPSSIRIRMLLSDMSVPQALPSRAGDNPGDDDRVRFRMERTARRYAGAVHDSVSELSELGLISNAAAEIRVHSAAPLFKLYLINDDEVFFGFYPVVQHLVKVNGEDLLIYDPMGKDASLFHYAADGPDGIGTAYCSETKRWFDSIWTTIARVQDDFA